MGKDAKYCRALSEARRAFRPRDLDLDEVGWEGGWILR